MANQYIDDGQTRPFFLRGVKGLYPDLRGERRLTLAAQRNAAQRDAGRRTTASDILAVYHKLAAQKIVNWDATDDAGKVLPINADSLGHLHPALWDRLVDVVMGYDAGDLAEDATPTERDELDDALAAGDKGQSADDALAETSVKN